MRRPSVPAFVAALLIGLLPAPAQGETRMERLDRELGEARQAQAESLARIAALERRLQTVESRPAAQGGGARFEEFSTRLLELESSRNEAAQALPDWLRRTRLSGSAELGYFDGQTKSLMEDSGFKIWDARLFVDTNLGSDAMIGERKLFRDLGLHFEWNLVRRGELENDVGELYVDLQGFLDTGWINFQVGRFQIPFGETYLRYSTGYHDDPFITKPFGGPWFWDEGVKIYGSDAGGRLGYVASVTNGETPFNKDANGNKQLTLKLFTDPWKWLHLSASVLRSGRLGSEQMPALAAIWFGESFPMAFGLGSGVPNYDHGEPIPDGPFQLRNVGAVEADAIFRLRDRARLWLSYGAVDVNSYGSGRYNRSLRYWIGEMLLQGSLLSEKIAPLYLALRANGYGTYDRNEGYLLEPRYAGELGWNMESIEAYSLALGWRLTDRAALRAEVTRQDIGLVRGVADDLRRAAGGSNFFAVALGVHF